MSKSKDGALNVKSIDVYTKNPNKNITDLERFQCGGFDIGGAKLTKETKQCKTGKVLGTSLKNETLKFKTYSIFLTFKGSTSPF